MIEQYGPARSMPSLRQMMDRLMADAFVLPGQGQTSSSDGQDLATDTPALNVYEEGDDVVVEIYLPGTTAEALEITVVGDTLTINAATEPESKQQGRNYLHREQRRGARKRSVRLPSNVDSTQARANFENGVLRVTSPRSERSRRRQVSVNSGSEQGQANQSQQPMTGQTTMPASGQNRESQDTNRAASESSRGESRSAG